MTHDTAVRTIVSLVPEIEKKGAEAVLLEHAEVENLPPAQLEKLAQVFNTLRTIDHIDKHSSDEERGKSCALVDVPTLVTSYVTRNKHEKAAASISARSSSHDPSVIDLMSAVRFDQPTIAKAATAQRPAVKRIGRAQMQELALGLAIDSREAMEKLATELLGKLPQMSDGSLDIRTAIADARQHCNDEVLKNSIEWLKSASVRPLYGADVELPIVKRAFAITGACGRVLADFSCEFTTHKLMRKLAGVAADPSDPKTQMSDEEMERELREFARAEGLDDVELFDTPEAEEAPTPDFVQKNTSDAPTKKPEPTPSAEKSQTTAGNSRVTKLLNAIGAPVRAAGNVIDDATSYAKGQLERAIGKERFNRDQMRSDMDVEDVRRAIGIRRMIGTDPVLRESDPREVLEIYNAISRTNPEIAHNMPALRLLLREAVSYEGLTLDSQKQLTDIRSNASKAEEQEANNLKRRYTISGSDGAKSRTK